MQAAGRYEEPRFLKDTALQSFMRGLKDDLAYGLTLKDPGISEEALKVAEQLEQRVSNKYQGSQRYDYYLSHYVRREEPSPYSADYHGYQRGRSRSQNFVSDYGSHGSPYARGSGASPEPYRLTSGKTLPCGWGISPEPSHFETYRNPT